MPKELRIDNSRKVDELVGQDTLADMLRRRRIAIEEGDPEEAQRITEEWAQSQEQKKNRKN